ncbi:MAG: hypothetical protein SF162_12885 [bacterium]|nr:hypothetical protein [bacterium]
MQTTRELGSEIGRHQSSRNTLIAWIAAGIAIAVVGVLLFLANPVVGFFIIPLGILVALYGIVRNPVGSSATIYEHGFTIEAFGKSRTLYFSDLDRYTVIYKPEIEGGDVGIASAAILNRGRHKPFRYVFFSGDTKQLVLRPSFTGWDTLGEQLSQNIAQRFAEDVRTKWANGEAVVLTYLLPPTGKNMFTLPGAKLDTMRLTLSREGMQQDDGKLFEWQHIDFLPNAFDAPIASFYKTGVGGISFLRLASPNGLVVETFIKEQVAAHRAERQAHTDQLSENEPPAPDPSASG